MAQVFVIPIIFLMIMELGFYHFLGKFIYLFIFLLTNISNLFTKVKKDRVDISFGKRTILNKLCLLCSQKYRPSNPAFPIKYNLIFQSF